VLARCLCAVVLLFFLAVPAVRPASAWGVSVVLDGDKLSFDVPPVIHDGRTLVPLRGIFEALGAEVQWDGATRTVTAVRDGTTVVLTIGAKTAHKNGAPVTLDVPAKIVSGRTLVPLRFVSESLGAGVRWVQETRTVVITSELITDMFWNSNMKIIEITLNKFPSTWGNWIMYIDGKEMPMGGGPGNPVVRPNAPLDKSPTGLIIGTLPWVSPLTEADFPCCGVIQFYIPGDGFTNKYEFNLVDFDCKTASKKKCSSEWIKHRGDLVIGGRETKIIENVKYVQEGNIYVNDQAKLIIRNSRLMVDRGNVSTVHVYIFIAPEASLEIENSSIFPHNGDVLVCVFNEGKVSITDSPTSIHYFHMFEGAQLNMLNSEMVFTIGGLLQVEGGDTTLINSTIGALGLRVPAGAHLNINGLKSGVYFESWDVHDMISGADYNLVLKRTRILKDDFTGELKHGPYERGWLFFLDPNAHVKISNSELRKVFIDLINEDVEFENLRVGIPSSLNYRDIKLKDVIVMGQWPFTIRDSNVTTKNSDYLFLQPSGRSTVTLINSHMCEFIPRDFFGTMIFENGLWTNAGEIIGGVPYHSMENDFTIKGSLKIEGVKENLKWKDARVTREYEVIIKDENGNPIEGALIKINGETFVSDDAGQAKFSLIFNEFNYIEPKRLEVWKGENLIAQKEIDFFTETPVIIVED